MVDGPELVFERRPPPGLPLLVGLSACAAPGLFGAWQLAEQLGLVRLLSQGYPGGKVPVFLTFIGLASLSPFTVHALIALARARYGRALLRRDRLEFRPALHHPPILSVIPAHVRSIEDGWWGLRVDILGRDWREPRLLIPIHGPAERAQALAFLAEAVGLPEGCLPPGRRAGDDLAQPPPDPA